MLKMIAGSILFLIGVLMILAGLTLAHGAINVKHHNSLGVVQYEDNPYTYLEGSITDIAVVGDNYEAVNFRVQPRATYALFTQELLLCNQGVGDLINGKSNPLVLTYETVAHRTVDGIGCHRLVAVDEVAEAK